MALDKDTYQRLKDEVESASSEAQRARGALEEHMKRLQDEFECETLDEAREELKSLQSKASKAEKEFDKALAQYEKDWKGDKDGDE